MVRIMDSSRNTIAEISGGRIRNYRGKDGYVRDKLITDSSGNTMGYIEGDRILDASRNTIGYIRGDRIDYRSKSFYISGTSILDGSRNTLGYIDSSSYDLAEITAYIVFFSPWA